jgi:hypothetical protein
MDSVNTVENLQPILKQTYSTCKKCGKKIKKKEK